MDKSTIRYTDWLGTKLRDKRRAARYLNAARSDSPEAFFKALRKVAEARQMTRVAENAGISRENLYKITSAIGNPTYTSLDGILKALDLDLEIIPRHASSEKGSNSQTFGSKASEAAAQEHSGKHTTLEGRGTCQIAGALDTIRGSSSGQHTSYPFSDMLWTSQTSPSVYAMTQPATPSVVRFVLKPSKRDSPSQELVNVYGR